MDADTLATMITILVAVLGSSAVTIGTVLKQTNHLDAKFTKALKELSDEVKENSVKLTENSVKLTENGRRLTRVEEQVTENSVKLTENGRRLARVEEQVTENSVKLTENGGRLARVEEQVTENGRRLDELSESSKERGRVLGEVRERLSRMEGYLMAPEGFTLHRTPEPDADDPSAGDSGTEHREAG